ncbi:unnamed protein product [Rhizoctonia solani]|uniref:MFS general substrate transporter n=1 Tax=Rhizoctonia solani TaxID=456999 RepID=A0A8H3D8B6_9AGAM|nr:unnamed protein product [Rhizoctonia solani]
MELEDVKDKKSNELSQIVTREDVAQGDSSSSVGSHSPEVYRLYKRRWLGLVGICLLNIISGLNWLWFSSIAINTSQEFGVSLERVNWLGNSVNLVYLPVSVIVPLGFSRWGLRISCVVGSLGLLISAWIRYAGTTPSLSPDGRYALLLIGQIFTGFSQPWFQILGPKYSETWFDLRGRTTATMIIAIANPIGAALSQLIAPAFSTVRESVLILGIITSVVAPTALLIASKPPIPPSTCTPTDIALINSPILTNLIALAYAGSHPSPPAVQIFRAFVGKPHQGEAFMSPRERLDMTIVTFLFGAFVGAFSAFSILINQIFAPYGYSSDAAGIMGGVLILAGIIGAAILSPIFDRYLTHHLALAAKILVPLLAASYIALIWDVRANNYAGLYVVMVVIGVASFTLLPIALEIGCEVTRSAETSSAVLWFAGNLLSVVLVLSMDALKDHSSDANPPSNMFKSLIFQACFVALLSNWHAVIRRIMLEPVDEKNEVLVEPTVEKGDNIVPSTVSQVDIVQYRLYKRRWAGLLGICILNIVASVGLTWFPSIAIITSKEFGISLERINWLSNCNNVVYFPVSVVIPIVSSRYGLRISCLIGTVLAFIAAWVRYAGTASSLSPDGKFSLLLLSQASIILLAIGQPWFQVLGPKYSELWFDLKGRTTSTTLIALSNPIGSAVGHLVAPFCPTVRSSVLILAVSTTVLLPCALLIQKAPPIPPTYAGSLPSPPPAQVLRAFLGRPRRGELMMAFRERTDAVINTLVFGSLVAGFTAVSVLLAQTIAPYGYESGVAGIMGAVCILSGVVGAIIASPIFDRYLTHHLGIACKIIVPILSACYIALIWAVRENNTAGLYVVLVVLGIGSFTLLPVALEMGCEITRSPEVSSAVLWSSGNLLTLVFITVMDHLRDDSPSANPPSNMRKSLIFQASFVSACTVFIVGLKAKQTRRELDVQMQRERDGKEPS